MKRSAGGASNNLHLALQKGARLSFHRLAWPRPLSRSETNFLSLSLINSPSTISRMRLEAPSAFRSWPTGSVASSTPEFRCVAHHVSGLKKSALRYVVLIVNEEAALKNRPQMHLRFRHATLPVRTEVRAKHDDEDADDVDDDVDDADDADDDGDHQAFN